MMIPMIIFYFNEKNTSVICHFILFDFEKLTSRVRKIKFIIYRYIFKADRVSGELLRGYAWLTLLKVLKNGNRNDTLMKYAVKRLSL